MAFDLPPSSLRAGILSDESPPLRVLVLESVLVGLSSPLCLVASATCRSVASLEISVVSRWYSFLSSSGFGTIDGVVVVIAAEVEVVVEGAGPNEEEVELAGDGSIDEAESMQTAESREDVEILRFVRALIQAC